MKSGRLLLWVVGLLSMLLFSTCEKDEDNPTGKYKAEITSITISQVQYKNASIIVQVEISGNHEINNHGFCISIETSPDKSDSIINLGNYSSNESFSASIENLLPETRYYIKAFLDLPEGTLFSKEVSFTTLKTGKPLIVTDSVHSITYNSAIFEATILSDSGLIVTTRGFTWGKNTSPGMMDSIREINDSTDKFSLNLNSLQYTTTYYVQAFAKNESGISYGNIIEFITFPDVPVVITGATSELTKNSVICSGEVITDGGAQINARGICYSISENPTIIGSHTTDGTGTGQFISHLNNLSASTKYYYRAYGNNIAGISYGLQRSFQTLSDPLLPVVITNDVTNITTTYALSGGNVISTGGLPVTAYGLCWSNNPGPTLQDTHSIDGSGSGSFITNIINLSPGTNYYLRAYATNSLGTSYGNEVTFTTEIEHTIPTVTTSSATDITSNSTVTGGNVINSGGDIVTSRGVCWSTSLNPSLAGNHTTNGSGSGSFISNLSGLNALTTYYVRAYATNISGTAYGAQISFTTSESVVVPTLTTANISSIGSNSAVSGGTISNDGGAPVTDRGVCWSTSQNPTISNSYTINGNGTGTFTSNLTGLSASTNYYVRAYATNSAGTAYGNEKSFTTIPTVTIPSVTTAAITSITSTTAVSGGNVTSTGGATVTVRGICWNTSQNPTIFNAHTFDGSGIGTFVSNLSGLTPLTNYYVRAYATNSEGTAYGNQENFTTLNESAIACPEIPIVTYEGRIYNTILIGTQCWLKENLNVGNRIDVYQSQSDNNIKEKYCYDNLDSNCEAYGGLYQWDEMMQYISNEGYQGLCPSGWHIPTQSEFSSLITHLGGSSIAGGKMKEAGNTHWVFPNTGATNSSGFTSLPGGHIYYDGGFTLLGYRSDHWTSTLTSSEIASNTNLFYDGANVTISGDYRASSLSVRCLKDDQVPSLPTISTSTIINITQNSATSGGNITSGGGATVTARGVCWSTSQNPNLSDNHTSDGTGTGVFVSNLTDLIPSTTYYVRAYATNSQGTAYGNQLSFSTTEEFICGTSTISDLDGNIYSTVQIGNQCWMAENLKTGTMILGSSEQTNNGITEKYCFDNDMQNCETYGGLYQWNEFMNYNLIPGSQGICPTSWHIPTDEEWTILINFLGGETISGGKLKEAGLVHWNSPNTGASNQSGFTGLPGGYLNDLHSFTGIGIQGIMWSSSENTSDMFFYRSLYYSNTSTIRGSAYSEYGFSVRCIND